MEFRKFGSKYVVRLDRPEEVVGTLKKFCEEQGITLGWIMGIGAVNKAKVGLFDTTSKEYYSGVLEGDFEITSLTGNISTMNGEVYLHLHINLADQEHQTYGGHLNEAYISATGEFVVEAIAGNVEREFSPEVGLNLYKFL
jgi:predicted DNA-binding protein with PD1-like motif